MHILWLLCAALVALNAGELGAQTSNLGALEIDRFGCEADRIHQGTNVNDHMGHVLASGDWNGDGIDDLLTAGLHADLGPCESEPPVDIFVGKVWLFLGSATTPPTTPHLRIEKIPVVDKFAPPISFIGDIDDDGRDDIAIGLPTSYEHSPGVNTGSVWILTSSGTWDAEPQPIEFNSQTVVPDVEIHAPSNQWLVGDQPHFGFSIAPAGDVNGDGWEDLVIGAPGSPHDPRAASVACPQNPNPAPDDPEISGKAFIFAGRDPDAWGSLGAFTLWAILDGGAEATPGDRFGWSVAGAGSVDGDPFDDVVIGAPQASVTGKLMFNTPQSGYAHLYRGQSSTPAPFNNLTAYPVVPSAGPGNPAMFGHSLAGGVDLDGAPGTEFLIGAPFYSVDGNLQGAVYAYSWNAALSTLEGAFPGLQPITLDTNLPAPPPDSFQDEFGRFGWSIASLPGSASEGQYNPYDLPTAGDREFVVSAFLNGNEVDSTTCGAPQGGRQSGRAFVLSVSPDPFSSTVAVQSVFKGEDATRMRLGTSLATGDFDADGLLDVASGGSGYAVVGGVSEIGRIYVFRNTSTPPP